MVMDMTDGMGMVEMVVLMSAQVGVGMAQSGQTAAEEGETDADHE